MNLSEETKTVEKILAGPKVENRYEAELRIASENIVLAKAFVKAAFFDLQQEMFVDPQYSKHRIERMQAQTGKFNEALLDYQTAENKLTVIMSPVVPPVGVGATKPGDLSPNKEEAEILREFDLGLDDPSH